MCESKKSIWIYVGIIVAVCIQLAIPFYMMMTRECILRHGTRVWIAQDPNYYARTYNRMEGAYANVKLSICHLDSTQFCDTNFVIGSPCYALLKTNADGLQEVDTVLHKHPGYGIVLKGKVCNRRFDRSEGNMIIDYQLNRIYTQQGKADALNDPEVIYEQNSNIYKFPRSAMQLEVAIGKSGTGILTGKYRYPEVIRSIMKKRTNDHPFMTYRIENRTDTDYIVPMYNGLPKIEILATEQKNWDMQISTVLWETPMEMQPQNIVVPKGETYEKVLPFDITENFVNIRKKNTCHWNPNIKVRLFTKGESEVCEELEIYCY